MAVTKLEEGRISVSGYTWASIIWVSIYIVRHFLFDCVKCDRCEIYHAYKSYLSVQRNNTLKMVPLIYNTVNSVLILDQ